MIELDCMVEKLHLIATQAMTGNNKNDPKKKLSLRSVWGITIK